MNRLNIVNVCPTCHAVTYDDSGWRYANKYNSTRFCLCCNTAMDCYKDGWLTEYWLNNEIKQHKEWMKNNK